MTSEGDNGEDNGAGDESDSARLSVEEQLDLALAKNQLLVEKLQDLRAAYVAKEEDVAAERERLQRAVILLRSERAQLEADKAMWSSYYEETRAMRATLAAEAETTAAMQRLLAEQAAQHSPKAIAELLADEIASAPLLARLADDVAALRVQVQQQQQQQQPRFRFLAWTLTLGAVAVAAAFVVGRWLLTLEGRHGHGHLDQQQQQEVS